MHDINELLQSVRDYSEQKAIYDLLEAGVDVNFVDEMLGKLNNGVLQRYSKADLISEVKKYLIGEKEKKGALERYSKQVASDVTTQYIANYTQVLSEDQGLEFYIYLGNKQKSTRCFCAERFNQYFHRKEIQLWGEGKTGEAVSGDCGYPWAGMIAGTNSSNIFVYRGGWACEHQIVPVIEEQVPKEVLLRALSNGYWKPSEGRKKQLGLD